MSNTVDWSKAPADATFYACGIFRKTGFSWQNDKWVESCYTQDFCAGYVDYQERPEPQEKPKASDASVSVANLLNAHVSIAQARKSSEFSEQNAELADQAEAILQAIIGNLKSERIPAGASFHLANAQNELSACAKLLEGDKALADAVFCIGEKLAGIRKGEL
jgi:hypothetical protein